MKLPVADCPFGYPDSQLHEILDDRYKEFWSWMRGQTFSICEGLIYDHELGEYVKGCETPHGFVVYASDVKRFLNGEPVVD